jgi:hypothetical protein
MHHHYHAQIIFARPFSPRVFGRAVEMETATKRKHTQITHAASPGHHETEKPLQPGEWKEIFEAPWDFA